MKINKKVFNQSKKMDNQKKLEINKNFIYLLQENKNVNFRVFRQKYNMREKNFHIQLRNRQNEIKKIHSF